MDASDFPRADTQPYDETDPRHNQNHHSSNGSSTPVTPGAESSGAWDGESEPGSPQTPTAADGSKPPKARKRRPSSASSTQSGASSQAGGGTRSIMVVARFRPENALELSSGGLNNVNYDPDGKTVSVKMEAGKSGTETHDFKFERVLPPSTQQSEVYSYIGSPIVDALFQGVNCSCLAYGQTGSGKTYSMLGAVDRMGFIVDQPGIMPRMFNDIFDKIESMQDTHDCIFNFSFVELYMERIRDLLVYLPLGRTRLHKNSSNDDDDTSPASKRGGRRAANLDVDNSAYIPNDIATAMKTDAGPPPHQVERWRHMSAFGGGIADDQAALEIRDSGNGLYITNCTSIWVQNAADAMTVVQRGLQYRTTAQTKQNAASSRSHAIMVCTLICKDRQSLVTTQAQLYLVDLAGSERVSKSETEGLLLEEAKSINLSLFCLGQVITALAEKASKRSGTHHIPYRDSKLTRLMENSLGGNALTFVVCTVSPSSYNDGETISTLRFGSKTQLVKTAPRRNASQTVEELQFLLEKAKQEIDMQKATINMLRMQLMNKNNGNGGVSSVVHPASPGSDTIDPMSPLTPLPPATKPLTPGTALYRVANEKHERLVDIVKGLLMCPLTGRPMRDPVFCLDGNTYERSSIFQHLCQNDMISPMTGQRVLMSTLTTNSAVQAVQSICKDEGLLIGSQTDLDKYQSPFFAWPVVYTILHFLHHDDRLWLATLNSQFARAVYNKDMWEEPVRKLLDAASDELKRHVKQANLPAHKVYVLLNRNLKNPERARQQLQRYIIQPMSMVSLFSSRLEKERKRFNKKKKDDDDE